MRRSTADSVHATSRRSALRVLAAMMLAGGLAACGRQANVPTSSTPASSAPAPSAAVAAATTVPDLSGVWRLAAPVEKLQTTAGGAPPLLPAAQMEYEKHQQAAARGDRSWDPVTWCKPPGEPRTLLQDAWPFEIVQTGNRVEFLYQWNRLTRAIPLLPKQDTFVGPFYFGQSVGEWEGNTLVVDVVGVNGDTFLDPSGLPHTDDMHMTERFQLSADGQSLDLVLQIEDPATYSAPWQSRLRFVRQPAGSVREDDCEVRLHQEARYPVLPQRLYPK